MNYFPSGNLKNSYYWEKGEKIFNNFDFYDTIGTKFVQIDNDTFAIDFSMLKKHEYYYPKGNLHYSISITENQRLEKETKNHFVLFQFPDEKKDYNVNETFEIRIYVVSTGYTENQLIINLTLNGIHEETETLELDRNINMYYYAKKLGKTGRYHAEFISILDYSDGLNYTSMDTAYFEFTVKGAAI